MSTNENLDSSHQIREAVRKDYTRVVESASGAYSSDDSASCDCCGQAATETDKLQEFLGNVTSVHVEAVK